MSWVAARVHFCGSGVLDLGQGIQNWDLVVAGAPTLLGSLCRSDARLVVGASQGNEALQGVRA